jgi:hypothetical protein
VKIRKIAIYALLTAAMLIAAMGKHLFFPLALVAIAIILIGTQD